ncbi:TadG family pilus assembly protein [Bradyrhizobium prioriisuperbiae]|uniref:TadG family pilus assembly protein n=1 Tax=Bradyrhizobium prioriisuperbiae TaxID=2854389 RepID=UPI0028ECA5B8|nr:TadG family pilus assembly protein [Bradyrhizobium prioritasuperba]
MRDLLRRFRRDQRGNIAMMGAFTMLTVCGFAAFGVDLGSIFADRRKTQSVADLAAIVAAGDPANAAKAAKAAVVKNNYPADSLVSVEYGTYVADATLTVPQRFTPAAAPGPTTNAVRVTVQTKTPLFFGKLLTGKDSYDIRTSATAATTAMASFAIGSRLASLNDGVLNQLLGTLLGTKLSLSLMDYNALLSAKVDAFSFLSALATQVNLTAGTYDQLLQGEVKLPDLVAALLNAQRSTNGNDAATIALSKVSQGLIGLLTKIVPQSLIDPGPYAVLQAGQKPLFGLPISVLDLLQAIAVLGNGTHQIAAGLNLNIPGIASVQLQAAVGERPVGTSWITVGTKGASVHTAQTRVLLQVQLLGSGAASVVNLPLYVEVASATATLDALQCGYPDIGTSSVTLGVKPGVVDAWIGGVSTAELTNFSVQPNPPAATLVNVLGLVKVTGRAHALIGNTTPTSVNFSYADIQAQTRKTVNSTSFVSSLLGSLLGNLDLRVSILGLGLDLGPLLQLVGNILAAVTAPVDQLLASVLQTLGVSLGQADVWTTGIRCDSAVLVN